MLSAQIRNIENQVMHHLAEPPLRHLPQILLQRRLAHHASALTLAFTEALQARKPRLCLALGRHHLRESLTLLVFLRPMWTGESCWPPMLHENPSPAREILPTLARNQLRIWLVEPTLLISAPCLLRLYLTQKTLAQRALLLRCPRRNNISGSQTTTNHPAHRMRRQR